MYMCNYNKYIMCICWPLCRWHTKATQRPQYGGPCGSGVDHGCLSEWFFGRCNHRNLCIRFVSVSIIILPISSMSLLPIICSNTPVLPMISTNISCEKYLHHLKSPLQLVNAGDLRQGAMFTSAEMHSIEASRPLSPTCDDFLSFWVAKTLGDLLHLRDKRTA